MPQGVQTANDQPLPRHPTPADMAPLIITCAVTGDHQKAANPHLPITASEQAEAAVEISAAGAAIIHIHGRRADDPSLGSTDPARYREINAAIRAKAPDIIIDNTQTVEPLPIAERVLAGNVYYYKSAPMAANPEIMALNPGPMTFRGGAGAPSSAYVATFDDTERAANGLRERGIKPQVFLYHPGHLDLLEYLISREALDPPYFVQLVFGQQGGIRYTPDNVSLMIRNLPDGCIFQTCALGLEAIQVNTLAILSGGHVRTGMEDCLFYQRNETAQNNAQLVERIVRIAHDVGRSVATAREARQMLGLSEPTSY